MADLCQQRYQLVFFLFVETAHADCDLTVVNWPNSLNELHTLRREHDIHLATIINAAASDNEFILFEGIEKTRYSCPRDTKLAGDFCGHDTFFATKNRDTPKCHMTAQGQVVICQSPFQFNLNFPRCLKKRIQCKDRERVNFFVVFGLLFDCLKRGEVMRNGNLLQGVLSPLATKGRECPL